MQRRKKKYNFPPRKVNFFTVRIVGLKVAGSIGRRYDKFA